jgi:hypothetical protein
MALVINLLSVESFDSWPKILDRIYRSPYKARGGIFKYLWSPRIDPKESILPAYVAWRDGTTTLFLLGS